MAVAKRIRSLAPEVPLFVRTDALEEVDELLVLDATHVVQPEFEAALALAREAMEALGVEGSVFRRALEQERRKRFKPVVDHPPTP